MGWEGPFLNLAFVWEGLGLGRRTEGQGVRGYYCPSQGVDHGGNDLAQVKIDSEPDENEGTLVSPARLEYYPKSITTLLYFLTSNLRDQDIQSVWDGKLVCAPVPRHTSTMEVGPRPHSCRKSCLKGPGAAGGVPWRSSQLSEQLPHLQREEKHGPPASLMEISRVTMSSFLPTTLHRASQG